MPLPGIVFTDTKPAKNPPKPLHNIKIAGSDIWGYFPGSSYRLPAPLSHILPDSQIVHADAYDILYSYLGLHSADTTYVQIRIIKYVSLLIASASLFSFS